MAGEVKEWVQGGESCPQSRLITKEETMKHTPGKWQVTPDKTRVLHHLLKNAKPTPA
jgi:hypothetical protein